MVVEARCHMLMEEWVEKDMLRVPHPAKESPGLKDLGNLVKRDAERLIADMDEAGIGKGGGRWQRSP